MIDELPIERSKYEHDVLFAFEMGMLCGTKLTYEEYKERGKAILQEFAKFYYLNLENLTEME